ncbi:MAG: bifunctional DNA-formamidopyrimidine glycosylase/DNA-(apurinic or apyrimidinic site) lyase [Actinomyces sp.]|uniref:bifunctional DNA-formamidopyrimidine glycosylase/DNA-(apurinic or apyrimidinic site) lyase n=1 Tax=Actinomyces sp. TaxID=29317 RepID=UPI0026DCFD15|nr:bifunctional DNA-formamidopyrimidine glycosylase/DNA-(apurinic or apyrimidinic site) lyase [Actinomyces sp.]MDO4242660.1 bifunctional DNA-formamidopyrimidine glycosylase/DNA-(apurinic or apyrimidinic site) lyase [Actinomyces sp.]
MPELPEVEAVRRGLARHLTGRSVERVEVLDPRPLRRQEGGPQAFAQGLSGRTITGAVRRGKFLWLPLDDGAAVSAHLGMSGQLLVRGTGTAPPPQLERQAVVDPAAEGADLTARRPPALRPGVEARPRHLRVRLHLAARPGDAPGGAALDLVDQRMFGGLRLSALVPTADGGPGGEGSPETRLPRDAAHIARDLLDPDLDRSALEARAGRSARAVKTLLLDQRLVSGVGNIYADEGLWAARVHGLRPGSGLAPDRLAELFDRTAEVMTRALAAGGTSFDSLYVDAEGAAGYFARELAAYGRAGRPCRRCGTTLRTERLAGRSHTSCPVCQVRPLET